MADNGVHMADNGVHMADKAKQGESLVLAASLPSERPMTPIPRLKVPFMVIEEFGYVRTSVGYYAGMITSALNLASFFAFLILSYMSDVYGRKPLLMLGQIGNIVSILLFGISKNLWMAIIFRALNGLLNGSGAIVKTYIREITDDTNQARVYTIRSTGYSVGTVAGSILGGMLAPVPSPLRHFAIFEKFPFILPCLVSAGINMITLFCTYFFLPETLPRIVKRQERETNGQKYRKIVEESYESSKDLEMVVLESISDVGNDDSLLTEVSKTKSTNEEHTVDNSTISFVKSSDTVTNGNDSTPADDVDDVPEFKAYMLTFWEALKGREVILTIVAYSFVSFCQLCFFEVFSVWAIQEPNHGGIKFGEKELGIVNGCGGVLMMISNLFIYHHLDRRFGTRLVFLVASGLVAFWYAAAPFLNLFYSSGYITLMVASAIFFGLTMQLGTTNFAAINLMINNVSSGKTAAAINGVSASISSFTRLLAPVTGGSLFALTANAGFPFPLDYHFAFLFISLLTAVQITFVFILPRESVEKRKL